MNNKLLLDNLRSIQDWPIKGVNFRDVTTLFKNPECLRTISDEMYELYKNKGITKIVGIESRGFVMSSYQIGCWNRLMSQAWQTPLRDRARKLRKRIRHRHHRNPQGCYQRE